MNEMTGTMGNNMYEEVAEINQLNRVEGFDPRKYMRRISREGQTDGYYLDVVYRKLWFRLKYPQGKIVKKLIKLTNEVAVVEAKVYLDRNDAEENFISNALAQKYQTSDGQFGNKYVELAETAAVGRALSDAGFGLQFADKENDFDPEVTEAPIDGQIMQGESMLSEDTYMEEEIIREADGTLIEQENGAEDEMIPGQHGIEEYIPMPAQRQPQQLIGQKTGPVTPVAGNRQSTAGASGSGIRKDMPVEQIYGMLNREAAASVVIPMGFNKGKTLGQVAVEKPNSLEWYVTSYGGPDNLLRAAAKFLIDAALAQAS